MAYFILAGVFAIAAVLGAVFISRRGGWNEMSDSMVVTRAVFCAFATSAAAWLFGTGVLPEEDMRITWVLVALFAFVFIAGLQANFVRLLRRRIVHVWRDGQQLPEGVSEDSVRRWAERHPG